MAVDRTGLFPWGIVIGAAVEIATQMISENRSVSEIDGSRVLIAAAAGGLTGGISSLSSTTMRVSAVAAVSVAEGAAKRAVEGDKTTVEDAVTDGAFGATVGGLAEGLVIMAQKSPAGKMIKETLRREENTLAGGRTRAAQVASVEAAQEAVDQIGRGAKEEAVCGVVSFCLQGATKMMTKPEKRDNTSVAVKPLIMQP